MRNINTETQNSFVNIGRELSKKVTVYTNLDHDIVVTTSDKIKLVLIDTKDVFISRRIWVTPMSILLTLIVALITTEFKQNIFGISADNWEGIFILSSLICSIWLINSIYIANKNKNKGGIDEVVERLKLNIIDNSSNSISANIPLINNEILYIKRATYGTDINSIDLTEILNSRIVNNSLTIFVSNDLAGDPDFGNLKKMIIEYVYNGNDYHLIVEENQELSIPK